MSAFDHDLVAVLISAYNPCVKILRNTLLSLNRQCYNHFCVWLANDGSDPKISKEIEKLSLDLKNSLKYPLFIQHFAKRNGQCYALNTIAKKAIKNFNPKYLAFLDYDRLWHHNHLSTLVVNLENNPKYAGAYTSRFINIKYQNKTIEKFRQSAQKIHRKIVWQEPPLYHAKHFVDTNSKFIKTSAFQKIGGWNEWVFRKKDWEFDLRLTACFQSFTYLPIDVVSSEYVLDIIPKKLSANLLTRELIYHLYKGHPYLKKQNWWPVKSDDPELIYVNEMIAKYKWQNFYLPNPDNFIFDCYERIPPDLLKYSSINQIRKHKPIFQSFNYNHLFLYNIGENKSDWGIPGRNAESY